MTKLSENFDELIAGYLEETASEQQLQQFFELMGQNEEARDIFCQHASLHGVLAWMHDQRIGTPSKERAERAGASKAVSLPNASSSWKVPLLILAASLATVALFSWFSLGTNLSTVTDPSQGEIAGEAKRGSQFLNNSVARIVRKVDCDWEGDRWSVVSTSQLGPGQTLKMARGLMELEFKSGAKVTLEAPVTFTVKSSMRGILAHGKLTAEIPESAHGFTVSTPSGDAIDLGTSFGLFVGQDGVTETHVFEGEVVVRSDATQSRNDELHLTDDMAVRVSRDQLESNRIAAVPKRFTRIEFKEEELPSPPIVDRKLSLWLSAERRYQTDEAGRISAWGDLRTKSNQATENAWQVDKAKRPLRVERALGERPAIRFDRGKFLVTEPLKLGVAQSVAVVFQMDTELVDKWGINENGRQIVNLNGPPHVVLRINDQKQLVSRIYTGYLTNDEGERKYVSVGRMKSKQIIDDSPVVAISVYDPTTDTSRLSINGEIVAKAKAPKLEPTETPRYIGSHMFLLNTNFLGDLGELMIYDTGLTESEATKLSKALMKKYDIASQPHEL